MEMSQLQCANQLLASGQPDKAASIFQQLARELQASQHPRKAANLHAMAAYAFASAKEEAQTLQQAQMALRFFLRLQMMPRAAQFYGNILEKMNKDNMYVSVGELEKEFGNALANVPIQSRGGPQQGSRHLPTSCPKCGAPLRSDEIEWIDQITACCSYCGSVVTLE
jgi:hypothetical protein